MSVRDERSSIGHAGILDEIYRRMEPPRLFQKLELAERGRRYVGRCPRCGKRELYVLKYDPRYPGLRARCNRATNCGYSASAWEYLRDAEGVPEERIFRTLAERAGLDLKQIARANGPDAARAWQRREQRAALHEAFWTWSQERLWSEAKFPASEEARTALFLGDRRYSEAISRQMGLGFLPSTDQTRAYLLSLEKFTSEDLAGAEFLDPAFDRKNEAGERLYTLAIPYPEQHSLIARITVPKSRIPADVPKYRYPKGLKLEAPAYMRSVDRKRAVVVVEGFLDAALGHALADLDGTLGAPEDRAKTAKRSASEAASKTLGNGTSPAAEAYAAGLGQFVATGTNRLNAAQIAALQAAGIRELVLSFDTDAPEPPAGAEGSDASAASLPGGPVGGAGSAPGGGAGEAGTLATLDRLAESGTFFARVLRIPSALGCKDPDEVLTRHGAGVWAELLRDRTVSEAVFRAEVLLRRAGLRLGANGSAPAPVSAELEEPGAFEPDFEASNPGLRRPDARALPSPIGSAAEKIAAESSPAASGAGSSAPAAPSAVQRDAVLADLAALVEREATRAHRALFLHELTGLIAGALGMDREALAAALRPFEARAALKRRAEALREAALAVPARLASLEQTLAREAPGAAAEQLGEAEDALRKGLEASAALAGAEGGANLPLEPVSLGAYAASLAVREEVLATPYGKLDENAAIHPGRITLVAARPSHGKTTFMVNLLVHWMKTQPQKRFVFFSYDGPREQLLSQVVSRLTRRHALRDVEDVLRANASALDGHPERADLGEKTRAALRWLEENGAEQRLFIIDRALTAKELERAVREIAAGGPLGAVMIDYIQQVRPGNGKKFETRQREVGYVSRCLQALAQETGTPVVAAAQLNRVSETQGKTDRPRLWQLREAGDLEQDATTVFGLYNHHQALSESFGAGEEASSAASVAGAGVWQGGAVIGSAASAGSMSSTRTPNRRRGRHAHGGNGHGLAAAAVMEEGSTDLLEEELRASRSLGASSRWIVPNALRSVPLDVEVLKAKHGRTHARIALTYDMVANFITDGRGDGAPEV
ncbi:MAG: AAA family ATPase [Planctomycetota bacterium]|nr:AAA family ATPase [Planctomycetota bacterium]